ncbi:MAG: divalent-cation tolerance protein CutA [Vampirovibrionales bacterium]|nr:divalent-cation tolerance protein CutA [Vampirovibrionales bacterium]
MTVDYCVVLSTCPDEPQALSIARAVVEQGLAACVNLSRGALSVYRWQGEIHQTPECALVIKTIATHIPALEALIRSLHSYQTPEFLVLPVSGGSEDYLQWLVDSCAIAPRIEDNPV